jgi:hypothetical protein
VNLTEARAIIAQRAKRATRATAMLAGCLPQQRAAITDPARLKALFCPRRSGKSWAIGIYLFLVALAHPASSCLYLGLTKATATGIMNKDIFRVINERFGIGAQWKETHSRWELPNGSYIYLRGADANAYEIAKVVGQKYRLAILDEASKYRYRVHEMVYGALLPAMGDDLGTIVLSGTPSNITTGLFYDVTNGIEGGWSVHRWTWKDNTFRLANIQRAHDELVASNPAIVGTPIYRQEWLGEWVVDTTALVYHFREDLNTAPALPKPAHEYTYMLGADLGFSDPSALVVGAYHDNDPTLYLVHAVKRTGLIISDVAEIIRSLWHQPSLGCLGPYPFVAMVADASALQGVEEMRQKHHLPLESAAKAGKRGVIEVYNSDLQTGRIKVLPGAMAIVDEWNALIWDEKRLAASPKKWEEDARFENHLSDAALYMWRKARNYDAVPAVAPAPAPFTPEWEQARFEREIASIDRMREAGGLVFDEPPPWLRGASG